MWSKGKGRGWVLHLFFPTRCLFCDRCVPYQVHCCNRCEPYTQLPPAYSGQMPMMELDDVELYSRFFYEDPIKQALHHFKFQGWLENANHFGYYMGDMLRSCLTDRLDWITYVPMDRKSEKKRGFNQAERLAQVLGKQLKVAVMALLLKPYATVAQHTLTAEQRNNHLSSAFVPNLAVRCEVKGQVVLLVDDVFTTGETVKQATRVLKQMGVRRVLVATACKTRYEKE